MPALQHLDLLRVEDTFSTDDAAAISSDYLDRCRRVRVGPLVTLVFENRLTLWFRIQELARLARFTSPKLIQRQLEWYTQLLPTDQQISAALWVWEPGCRPTPRVTLVQRALEHSRIGFRTETGREIRATSRPDRVHDRLIGLRNWVDFRYSAEDLAALADPSETWRVFVEAVGYHHESEPLTADVLQSLLSDLESNREC